MRVLLVPPKNNYPFPKPSIDIFGQGFPYIAGALKKAGHEVFGVNTNHLWCQDSAQLTLSKSLRKAIEKYQPHLIGVGGLSANYSFVRDAIRFVRQFAPDIPIVCGGGIITYDHQFIFTDLRPDFAINGEGEESIVALANYLEKGGNINSIVNISYWDNDTPVFTKTAYSNTKLEDLPWPDYSPFDLEAYLEGFNQADNIFTYTRTRPRIMPITLGRSCPFKCTFCCHTTGPTYRGRSIDNAIEEIVYFHDKYHFNLLLVYDELFSTRKERITEFCTKIKKVKADLKTDFDWTCSLRVNNVDKDVLAEMKDAGCIFIGYGFESASPTVLKSMKKGIIVDQIIRAIKLTDEAGLGVQANFIFGDIAETPETMHETLEFFNTWCTDKIVHLGPIVPYPGSKLFEHCINNGIIKDKKQYYGQIGCIGRYKINMTKMPDEEYFDLSNNIFRITDPLIHDHLPLKEAKIISCKQAGQFKFDLNAPLSSHRFLYDIKVNCPHCNKEVSYLYPLRATKQDQSEIVRLFCAKCNKRFIINISDHISERSIKAVENSTAAFFAAGDYAGVAMTGNRNEWQTFAALGLIGKPQEAIDGLSRFDHEDARFYTAVAHWMNGDDERAKYVLKDIPTPHAQNLLALISKPQIQVIAQTPWDWDDKDFQDNKFHVRQIGIQRIDSSQEFFEDIHKHYDRNNPPDFYFCNMAEWHILPLNLHELPCPVFGATADYDAHIQTVYSWLQIFDELIVASHTQWEEVRKLTNVPITSYLKLYGLPSSVPFLQPEPRDTDLFLSGTTLNPYHPDKVRIFHQILQMPEIVLRYVDGFTNSKSYFSELARSKISYSYVRFPALDGISTRGLEALAMGCAVVTQKESALAFYVDEKYGVVTYSAEKNDLTEVVRYVLGNWCEFQKCANRGSDLVRREFALPRIISQYLRLLTFLAAKPRLKRRMVQKSNLLQKRGVTKRGFIFPERVNLMMLGHNLQRYEYEKLVKNDKNPNIFIDTAREAALFLAHGIGQLAKTPDNIVSGRKLLNHALNIYKSGLDRFPKSLALRFNFVRTVFHFGFPSDVDEALRLSKEILQSPLLSWEIDAMEDVFPWDFYSAFFNYRRYFDTVKEILMDVTAKRETLVKLILASLHYYVGHYTGNIEHFQRATQMDPEFPFYTYHYARHLLNREGTNDFEEAIELLTKLAKDSMLFNEAFSMLEELRSKRKCNIQEFDTIAKNVYHFRKSRQIDNPTIERDDWMSIPLKHAQSLQNHTIVKNVPQVNVSSKTAPNILFFALEFKTWQNASHWAYSAGLGLEEGLEANGVKYITIPAIYEYPSSSPASWINYVRDICAGKKFDQVWFEISHSNLDEPFLEWVANIAPVRVGFLCESLETDPKEWVVNPKGTQRRLNAVEKRLRYLTHLVAVDEVDVDRFNANGQIPALWWHAGSVPEGYICKDSLPVQNNYAVFYGALYGDREKWLEYNALKGLLIRPEASPEYFTDLPKHFDELNATAERFLMNGKSFTDSFFNAYMKALRLIRRECYSLWLKGLQSGCATVNLPQFGKVYAGRVVEGMAAGRPVISWKIPERPKSRELFEDGKEILLYSRDNPEQLASHIQRIIREPAFAQRIVRNATQKLQSFFTTERFIKRVLDWVETGEDNLFKMPFAAKAIQLKEDTKTRMLESRKDCLVQLVHAGLWREGQPLRLHLGCGEQHFDGYINIDYPPAEHNVMQVKADVYANVTELDFPAGSVDEVRLHHVFEHFNRVTALAMLIKWHNWLKIGGKLHIETPDLVGSAKTLLAESSWKTKMGVVRHIAGDQSSGWAYHIDHWFPERFEHTLNRLGFSAVQTQSSSWPHEPFLSNVAAIAVKSQNVALAVQLTAADELLWESTVSPGEQPTFEIWKQQLRSILLDNREAMPHQAQSLIVTVHPHLNLPHQGGGIQGDNEYSPPLVGGVRGGGELLPLIGSQITDGLKVFQQSVSELPIDELHNFNQRDRDRWIHTKALTIPSGSHVLDIGAGTCPYMPLFAHCVYKAHDFKKYTGEKLGGTKEYGIIDYESDICAIPVPDNSFDIILCTEVLEHTPEPIEAMREMARILRPGGRLLITAPLGSGLHQLPYHYYGGFTPEWYKHFGSKFGLYVTEITPNGGFFKLLAQECARVAWTLPQHQHLHGNNVEFIRNLFGEWIPRYLFALEEKHFIDQFTVGYHVEAVKVRDIDIIQKMIDKDTQNVNLYIEAARSLINQGKFSNAKMYIEDALELNYNNSTLLEINQQLTDKL